MNVIFHRSGHELRAGEVGNDASGAGMEFIADGVHDDAPRDVW
jgi:hypothetical protein